MFKAFAINAKWFWKSCWVYRFFSEFFICLVSMYYWCFFVIIL